LKDDLKQKVTARFRGAFSRMAQNSFGHQLTAFQALLKRNLFARPDQISTQTQSDLIGEVISQRHFIISRVSKEIQFP
jgi:hypothetical protein